MSRSEQARPAPEGPRRVLLSGARHAVTDRPRAQPDVNPAIGVCTMGDVLAFIKPVKRPHALMEAYWDFWNPFFSWQELMAYNAAVAELTAGSTDGEVA